MKTFKDTIEMLASATGRTRADTKRVVTARAGNLMRLLYLGLLTTLLGLYLPAFVTQFAKWNNFKPDTKIAPELWRAYYQDTRKTCANDATLDRDCAANPRNSKLWESKLSQRDPEHAARSLALGSKGYWIGAAIAPATLHDARIRRANQLLLGWVLSSYRIWVDGKLEFSGAGNKDQHPIIIPISMARLAQPKPLHIAIQVFHDSEYSAPDFLNSLRGGEGFLTPASASTFRDFVTFWETVRPFSLLLAYMVIGSLFFSFWLSRRSKTEYFYMALFALASAFYQARMTSIFSATVSYSVTADLDMVLRFYIASFGLALGLAFARSRLAYFRYGAPLALGIPLLLTFALPDLHTKHLTTAWLRNWATPVFYAMGGIVCLIQCCHLYAQRKFSKALPVRVQRLALFAAGFMALSVFYMLQFMNLIPGIMRVMWLGMGFDHFVSVVYFGAIMLAEYREQESAPPTLASAQRPLLPSGLTGAVLMSRLDCPPWMQSVLRSHFHTSILKNNGAVVEREGELLAFFEHEVSADPALSALNAADELAYHVQLLADLHDCELGFRCGLATSSKSGHHGDDATRTATRLLELPVPSTTACAVTLNEELARRLLKQNRKFTVSIYSAPKNSSTKKPKWAA